MKNNGIKKMVITVEDAGPDTNVSVVLYRSDGSNVCSRGVHESDVDAAIAYHKAKALEQWSKS